MEELFSLPTYNRENAAGGAGKLDSGCKSEESVLLEGYLRPFPSILGPECTLWRGYLRPLPSILGTELLLSSLFEHFLIILVRGRAIFITYGVRQKDVTRRKPPSGAEMCSPCTGGCDPHRAAGTKSSPSVPREGGRRSTECRPLLRPPPNDLGETTT